ncbi:PBP1A family penicillin-binding protein [Paenibacillus sp. FSL M8-0228]|uniref:PBP1A family penicillin-binding protein n=1 Tax=Paenibacillus TaxID=44249 RepID=UPI00083D998F|nr:MULTISPECIES: PBP1A family penicillin-binding protein [Paenibacillus]MBO3286880.1 PBP1A family penicillin-binding protein [Paenibacillus polymyxa]MBP1307307.1 penicillin-binding protein 2A [Paenibacillus sp. 1182]ODB57216.1 penicillin-binding protein [Paenibacillus polymyxa]
MPNDSLSRSGNRNRNTSKEKPKGKKKKITGKRIGWTLFITAAVAIFCALGGYLFVMVNGEKIYDANKDKITVNETSKVYDRNGVLMGELSVQKSDPVKSEEIPDLLKKAFIATEDKRFMEHQGVDIWSIGRAAVKDIVARSAVEGGSTLTQQLAKNLFLTRDKTFFRKATEVSIAMALERRLTKDEIITLYLNRIWFGRSYSGIKAASEGYFGQTNLKELKLWQIATLAAIPKGPSKYNPISNPENSKARRAVVLQLMFEQGMIGKQEMEEAKAVNYNYKQPEKVQKYQNFMEYVMDEAEDALPGVSGNDLIIGGYKIHTTMDAQAQNALDQAMADDDMFEKSPDDQPVQASMVIINNQTGGIAAMAPGRDYKKGTFNRATQSRRQPGSAFKPIVAYAPALESGKFTMDTPLSNERQSFNGYSPKNLHGYSSTISMLDAITKSENIPPVWLLNQIGVEKGVQFAESVGIPMDKNDHSLAIALGGLSKGTNTLEMAQAYSAFANKGQFQKAYSIKQINNSDDQVVYTHEEETKSVMSEKTAYEMTQMMQNVVNSGTGRKARIDWPVAGKTGTTQSGISGNSGNRDIWFVGYTPEYTGAVWMGYDKPDSKHMLRNYSGQSAAFFGRVMGEALKGHPVTQFSEPKGYEPPVEQKPEEPVQATAPSGLSGSYSQDTQIVSLSWNAAEGDNVQYRVYRKESSEGSFRTIMEAMRGTSGEDTSPVAGKTYQYYVVAYGTDGKESAASNTISVEIPTETTPIDPQLGNDPNQDGTVPDNGENIDGQDGTDQGNTTPGGTDNGTGSDQVPTSPGGNNGNGTGGTGNSNDNFGNGNDTNTGNGQTTTPDSGITDENTMTNPENTDASTTGAIMDGSQESKSNGHSNSNRGRHNRD